MTAPAAIDHLVVAAASLEQGARWCERTLGVTPGPGGKHPLMGTHNLLLRLDAPRASRCYLEIIAIDPDAPAPGRVRWFELDDPARQAAIAAAPRLVHFVMRTPDAAAVLARWQARGIEAGPLLAAERMSLSGLLRWRIDVRADGGRAFDGLLPTVIEWGDRHPADGLPPSPLALRSLAMRHPAPQLLAAALADAALDGVAVEAGPPRLAAVLASPLGDVTLSSA